MFKIRYRVRTAEGKGRQKSETLYGLSGKKAARAVVEQRIRDASASKLEAEDLTFRDFVGTYWRPYLDRKGVKPSTRMSYGCASERHILPAFGDLQLMDVAPLHVEDLLQAKLKDGLSAKTILNLLRLVQGLFALAVDNDLIARSLVCDKHKPVVQRHEKAV